MPVLQTMLMNLMWKVLTEKFMGKMIVHGIELAADKLESERLRQIAADVAQALNE